MATKGMSARQLIAWIAFASADTSAGAAPPFDASPDTFALMYLWPALWIIALIVLLTLPSLELFRQRGNLRAVRAAGAP